MIYWEDNGLTNAKPKPWWVKRFALISNLWDSPVFQRRYSTHAAKPFIGPLKAFWLGAVIILVIEGLLYIFYRAELGTGIFHEIIFIVFIGGLSA